MSTAHSDVTIAEKPDDEPQAHGDAGSVTAEKPPSPPAHQEKEAIKEEPFSIYTKHEKWIIVALISMGATFSPLRYVVIAARVCWDGPSANSANLYLPAIPTIADAFGESIGRR